MGGRVVARGGVKNGIISCRGGPFSSKWRWKPQACCFQALHVWNVLTVFQEASLHRSALCSRVISEEPVICTHQAFLVFSVTAYPPWCRLPINNLPVFCPKLYLGRMFGPRCHLLPSIWFYICTLLHNKIHWSFRIKRKYPGFCFPLTVSYENVASIVLCGINREMCAHLMCFERIFPHPQHQI